MFFRKSKDSVRVTDERSPGSTETDPSRLVVILVLEGDPYAVVERVVTS